MLEILLKATPIYQQACTPLTKHKYSQHNFYLHINLISIMVLNKFYTRLSL